MSRRIRTIKPDVIADDPRAQTLSDAAWRLWVTLRTLADDFGHFRADPRYLAAQVFQDTGRTKKVPGYLGELADRGLIAVYEATSMTFGKLAGWDDEQRIDHRSLKTRLPCPESHTVKVIRDVSSILGEVSGPTGIDRDVAGLLGAGGEGKGEDRKGGGLEPAPASAQSRPISEPNTFEHPRSYTRAFTRGITAGVGYPTSPPTDKVIADYVLPALDTHAVGPDRKPLTDDRARAAWLEARAEEYAKTRDERGKGPKLTPFAFVDWLNERQRPRNSHLQAPAPGHGSGPEWAAKNANNRGDYTGRS